MQSPKGYKKESDRLANQSIEEDDGSLNTLMTNALKRKFAVCLRLLIFFLVLILFPTER